MSAYKMDTESKLCHCKDSMDHNHLVQKQSTRAKSRLYPYHRIYQRHAEPTVAEVAMEQIAKLNSVLLPWPLLV
jgi:hypothetical protein